ncbi:DUF7504 family protein [Haloarcula marina]|uniref:DUF7504 family protein n=1 Tax=Haloarcula marina TaxID=2961574 RepID=UPI0020B6DA45|nr:hypothetical protein [Halomicroarcula marina]
MTREDGQRAAPSIALEAGQQALLSVGSLKSPLSELPQSGADSLLVVSSTAPADLEDELATLDRDPRSVGHIPISGSDISYDGPMWTCDPLVPDDLTGLSMRLSTAMQGLEADRGWVMFDNLNVFLMYAREERVLRFLDHTMGLARERNLRGVYAVVADALDEQTYDVLRRTVDVELDRR